VSSFALETRLRGALASSGCVGAWAFAPDVEAKGYDFLSGRDRLAGKPMPVNEPAPSTRIRIAGVWRPAGRRRPPLRRPRECLYGEYV
jgi:hypothetical protein